jgi:hypothetical protein
VFNLLLWRPDRIEHIANHGLTPEAVEEAVFDDPCRRLFRGPRSEQDRTRYIYYLYGCTQSGPDGSAGPGKRPGLAHDGPRYDAKRTTTLRKLMIQRYPPHTEDVERLARFFDQVDTTELGEIEELPETPVRNLVNVSLRLPHRDLAVLKRVAAQEGLAPATFMRWVLHRFVRSLTPGQGPH